LFHEVALPELTVSNLGSVNFGVGTVYKYSSLRSTAHHAAEGAAPRIMLQQGAVMHAVIHVLRRQYTAQYREHLIR